MLNLDPRLIDDAIEAEFGTLADDIKRLMANPAAIRILERIFRPNGKSEGYAQDIVVTNAEPLRGSELVAACSRASKDWPTKEFTTRNILERLEAQGFVLKAKHKIIAVNSALKLLVKKGELEQTANAVGHRPAQFKLIHRFPRE